ncbi:energy transducer TonB [Pseudoalteromonas tetraodonis]
MESAPKGVFEKEGLRALKLWRFKPALLNGRLVKVEYAGTLEWKL